MTNKEPNLFIIGASKCGTTSLWHMLNLHPDVFMSDPKEPTFFSFSNYNTNMKWYLDLFYNVDKERIIGDASAVYSETTLIPEIAERIYNFNSKAKIIYIVREPASRLKSVWRQTLFSGHWHMQSYKNRTDLEVPTMPKEFEKAIFHYPLYIEACKYWTHLNNYRKYFKDENILLLFFEDLKKDSKTVYNKICSFLEIEPQQNENIFEIQNSSEGKTMDYNLVAQLKNNEKIFKVLKTAVNFIGIKAPRKTIDYNVTISSESEQKINTILKSEKENILVYGNKSLNFWE